MAPPLPDPAWSSGRGGRPFEASGLQRGVTRLTALKRVLNGIDTVLGFIEKYVTAIALLVFTVVIFCNVVGRYVFHNAIFWAEELSRYLNIYLVFIAISAGIKFDSHIGVDAVETLLLPKRYHKYMDILRFTITFVFLAITTCLGFNLAKQIWSLKQTSPAMQISMGIPYSALPIGLFMASIRCLMRIILLIIEPAQPDGEQDSEEVPSE